MRIPLPSADHIHQVIRRDYYLPGERPGDWNVSRFRKWDGNLPESRIKARIIERQIASPGDAQAGGQADPAPDVGQDGPVIGRK